MRSPSRSDPASSTRDSLRRLKQLGSSDGVAGDTEGTRGRGEVSTGTREYEVANGLAAVGDRQREDGVVVLGGCG